MSNGTKSDYTDTGKKVKSIYDGRVDLTYNEVYDVFIDNKGDEFIIDDVGDSRYWSISDDCYELVDDVANTVDTTNDINDNTKTKPKFKVGDKVKVVDIEQISQWTRAVEVEYAGVVVDVNVNVESTPYKVKLDECYYGWWFTDKCIELVSDGTKSDYTKTGKKAMCINSNRRDLTYKKVYDVFTTQDGVDFIIDDIGDKRYESLEFPLWCGVFDDANIENKTTKSESVVVRKFKVGDTVRVTSIDNIHEHTETFKVGDIEVIIDVDDDDYDEVPYQIRNWWFSESELELVTNDNSKTPIVSDGGSSSYYAQQIPKGMLERFNATGTIEAKDVIRLFLGNDFNMGNIFKAYCRIISLRNGKGKAGIDEQYDLAKVKYFSEDELNYYLENTNA